MELREVLALRKPEHDVDALFPGRWSPRAMSGEPVDKERLATLFEAARWAPSSMNNQPWRFFFARRDTEHWEVFLDLLTDSNKAWAHRAGALIVMVSKTTFDFNGKPSRTHSFDTGAAWMSLALQGSKLGLVVHGMQGFSYSRAHELLGLSGEYEVEAMCAVGMPGETADLPSPHRERETPNNRKPLDDIVFGGPPREGGAQ